MRHPVEACATSRSLTQPHAASRNLAQPHAATVCTSRGVRTQFDQSERGYSVRHGVYVTGSTSRGIRTPTINQSERDYSVRHGVHVTACVRNALCTPLCTSLHTPLHIPAHPSAHPFVHTPLHTPLHIPLCTPLRTSLHTHKNPARSVPILLLTLCVSWEVITKFIDENRENVAGAITFVSEN